MVENINRWFIAIGKREIKFNSIEANVEITVSFQDNIMLFTPADSLNSKL